MEKMTIPMNYYYKGTINCYLNLEKNEADGTFSVVTDYGETVATATSGHGLAKVLMDLNEDKYAYPIPIKGVASNG